MKRKLLALIVALATITMAFMLTACGKTKFDKDKNELAITVTDSVMEITAETTLEDYMKKLQSKEEISFKGTVDSVYGLYITEINGVKAGVSEAWMLYTTDAANSNSEWGSYEYDGKTLGSATLGVSNLIIKNGETYVWVLQKY